MKAVITVVGKDTVGILAKVSTVCSEYEANVVEVSQSVLQDMFAMIMLVELRKKNFGELSSRLDLRNTPELNFVYDEGMEHGAKIAEILKNI